MKAATGRRKPRPPKAAPVEAEPVADRDEAAADEDGDADLIAQCKTTYELAVEREAHNRREAEHDLRFVRLREQWDEVDAQQRKLDGRPSLTIDKLGPFVRQVVNDARQNRPAIKVHPVGSGANVETAEVFNGIIRSIEVNSDADTAYDTAIDFSVTSGLGYLKVNTRYCDDDTFQQDIVIERVADPFKIYGDPYSLAADSADWNDAFEVETLTPAEFKRRFPDADPVDWDEGPYQGLPECWRDGNSVLVLSWWHRDPTSKKVYAMSNGEVVAEDVLEERQAEFETDGVEVVGAPRTVQSHEVVQRILTGAAVLETVPWQGKYIPIVPIYGDDIIVKGKRYLSSLIRPSKDAQRGFNYSRSAEVEAVALAPKSPFIGPQGAFETDQDKWETANTDNHAFIEYDGPVAPQRAPYAGPPAGWMTLSSSFADDIKAGVGMFDATMGEGAANEQSGKAILGLQGRSDTSTFHFVDNESRGIRHVGRIVIDMIPHVYSGPRIAHVITGEGEHQQVPINQPIPQTGADGRPVPQLGADGQPIVDPISGQPIVVTNIYDLTAGKYALTVQAGPGFATRRQEAANQMVEVMEAAPQFAPAIAPRLAKMLDWPGAEEIADELDQLSQQHQQQNGPQAEQAAAQAKLQGEQQLAQQRMQMDQQQQQQRATADMQASHAKAASDAEIARTRMLADVALKREQAQQEIQLARERLEADIQLQTRKAELEAGLQQQRFALEAKMRQTPDPVVPGGEVG